MTYFILQLYNQQYRYTIQLRDLRGRFLRTVNSVVNAKRIVLSVVKQNGRQYQTRRECSAFNIFHSFFDSDFQYCLIYSNLQQTFPLLIKRSFLFLCIFRRSTSSLKLSSIFIIDFLTSPVSYASKYALILFQ